MKTNLFILSVAVFFISVPSFANNLSYSGTATVQSSQPNYVTTPSREECSETYEQRSNTSQQSSAGSPVVGKVIGGLLGAGVGSTIGKGKGNTIATATGAVLGSELGGEYLGGGNSSQASQPVKVIRCKTIPGETTISGYILTVLFDGRTMRVSSTSDVPAGYQIPVNVNVFPTGGQPIPPQQHQPQYQPPQPVLNNKTYKPYSPR